MTKYRYWTLGFAFLLAGAAAIGTSAQVKYATGQNVGPVFEGWEQNPDGTYSMVFGYLNRNYEEEVDIPLGPDNTIDPGGDRGQPTHFYPRRQRFVFKVVVPKDWDKQRRVVWTLTSHGRTDQAKGWLQPEWELNDEVIAENNGGGVLEANNEPPSITVGPVQSITLPNTATLTASATDDGLPKRSARPSPTSTVSDPNLSSNSAAPRRTGVQIKWILYRGPGKVKFDRDTSPDVYGQPATLTSKVSFETPGTYVLRAIASDGQLVSTQDVT
ncbi:MAG: hypothetical protein DMG12_05420, partial [Acidobacteria bacterium]